MKTILSKSALGILCMAAVVTLPHSSQAIVISLNQFNVGGYTGPFGTVTVTLVDSQTANITFASSVVAGNIYLFGDGSSIAFNVNASSWSVGPVTWANSGTGFSPATISDDGSQNVDGWGTFNQTFKSSDGFGDAADTLSVTITTSGSWASAADVLKKNSVTGYYVAAHIFVTSNPANQSNGAIITGFASGNTLPNDDDEPGAPDGGSTMALLGLSLMGAEYARRRFLKR